MGDLYDEAALFTFRKLGFTSFDQVDRLTLPEYRMHLKAQAYVEVDRDMERHTLAYLIQCAKATTGKGKNAKMKYPTFKSFFDYKKKLKELEKKPEESRFKNWRAYLKRKEEKTDGV